MNGKLNIFIAALVVTMGLGTGPVIALSKPAPAEIIDYKMDKAHSSVSFTIRHMMVSKVRGQFNDFDLTLEEDANDITKSSVAVTIKTASIDTGNEKRDNHLRSADFFDVAKFPEITFKSKGVKTGGEGYILWGTLTMNGVSREIDIPFVILGRLTDTHGNKRIGIEGSTALSRKDFGLTWNRTLDKGGVVVGDEVKIEILLEAISRKK